MHCFCHPPCRHQASLLRGQLYDMMDVDDQYDAAAAAFIRGAVARAQPFFFYFSSHHTVGACGRRAGRGG